MYGFYAALQQNAIKSTTWTDYSNNCVRTQKLKKKMKYSDLRDFINQLQRMGELKHIGTPISPFLEMTEICDRTLRAGGPALLFDQPSGHSIPVLGNLFGTTRRVALGMGAEDVN